VFVENKQAPTEREWDEFLTILAENRSELPKLRLLVMTTGGAPDTTQRKKLAATLGGTTLRVATVSDSMKTRFVAATISLFHRDHRLFSTTELDQAYEHLGLSVSERRLVEAAIKEMKPKVLGA
jgi:hexokinase